MKNVLILVLFLVSSIRALPLDDSLEIEKLKLFPVNETIQDEELTKEISGIILPPVNKGNETTIKLKLINSLKFSEEVKEIKLRKKRCGGGGGGCGCGGKCGGGGGGGGGRRYGGGGGGKRHGGGGGGGGKKVIVVVQKGGGGGGGGGKGGGCCHGCSCGKK